jgi:hypothetical protein
MIVITKAGGIRPYESLATLQLQKVLHSILMHRKKITCLFPLFLDNFFNEKLIPLFVSSFFVLLLFSKSKKGASSGRSFLPRKNATILQKAFHFYRGYALVLK